MNLKKMVLKTIFVFSLLVTILFILTSCASSPENMLSYNFKQGTTEMGLELLKNAPPDKIYPNSDFKIIVKLDNQAGYNIDTGKVSLVGTFEDYFQFAEQELPIQGLDGTSALLGRSLTTPSGEQTFLEFSGRALPLYLNAEQQDFTYFLRADYSSTMEFADSICINPDLYAVYDSGCKVEDRKSYSGQGAPLVVDSLEEIISPGATAGVEFRVHLASRGQGQVKNIILNTARLGGKEIPCVFIGGKEEMSRQINLEDIRDSSSFSGGFGSSSGGAKEAMLICKTTLEEFSSYTTTVSMDFSYDYTLRQEHKLTLVK